MILLLAFFSSAIAADRQDLARALAKHPDAAYVSDCMSRAVFLARGGRKAEARATLAAARERFLARNPSERDKTALLDNIRLIEESLDSMDLLPASERKKTAESDAKLKPCAAADAVDRK